MILISLGSRGTLDDFKKVLFDYIKEIDAVFGELKPDSGYQYRAETYYSLNCVDLCLVIRTDELSFIHMINRRLNEKAEKSKFDINTTVIFAVQNMKKEASGLEAVLYFILNYGQH